VGLESWLTPDTAALAALEQVTGESISSALDLHSTIAAGQYKLWTDGSMNMWRGHVGEHQIVEQVAAWDPDAVTMPDASNFPGADVSLFGEGYQVKFVQDFNTIDNIHGDPLIVADGTLNVPEDALVVDFSSPFDPSILEGHDVIVAEGLTLAGAQDAWESAVGIAAGGIDGGDISETLGDIAIPGMGAAIRVAASGYRRRAALADPDLRQRATGRVVRDVAYTTGGVTAGGSTGALIGAAVDVLSLGMTMGLGSVLGGMIGAGLGGSAAGKMAAAEDQAKIEAKVRQVRSAIAEFGRKATRVEETAQARWGEARATADRAAFQLEDERRKELQGVLVKASTDLDRLATIGPEEAQALIHDSVTRMNSVGPRSPRERRIRAAWGAAAERQRTAAKPDPTVVLSLVAGAPHGQRELDRWACSRWQRRTTVLAAAHAATGACVAGALSDRVWLGGELQRQKSEIQIWSRKELDKAVQPVGRANGELSRELKLAGR
jgi:hypothetical protein